MKVKGVDISKLTKSQQNTMKKHSKHHTKKHKHCVNLGCIDYRKKLRRYDARKNEKKEN